MKKLLFILLVAFGLQTQAQVMYCDSISYTTSSTLNYPLVLSGSSSMVPGTVSWNWQVCNANLCYSGSGTNASFGQVSLTDTLKVCYDVLIVGIAELELNTIYNGKMYDLLGREIFEVPIGTIYIKNRKKFIR